MHGKSLLSNDMMHVESSNKDEIMVRYWATLAVFVSERWHQLPTLVDRFGFDEAGTIYPHSPKPHLFPLSEYGSSGLSG